MNKIAIDIGYGYTKVKTAHKQFTFPSAVALEKNSIATFEKSNSFNFEGANYLVGLDALRDARITRDYSFLEKYAPLLVYYALIKAELDLTQPIELSTGLSLMNWPTVLNYAKRLGQFIINNQQINCNVRVTPQGKGSYLEFLSNNPQYKDKLIISVDIGTYTFDYLPFENGKALTSEAIADPSGTNKVITSLQKRINREYSISSTEAEVNGILQSKSLSIAGSKRDLSLWINEEVTWYWDLICDKIKMQNIDLYNRADLIVLSGGGANLLAEHITGKHVIVMDEAQNANVNGFWSIL